MTIGLVGRKCGMTRVFTDDGVSIPVTVIEVLPNRVTQIKTVDNDGYMAIQVTTGTCKRSRLSKAEAGHFAKAGVEPGYELREFNVEDTKQIEGITLGSELKVDIFSVGQYVDVSGTTKGKGFAVRSNGTILEHKMHLTVTHYRIAPQDPLAKDNLLVRSLTVRKCADIWAMYKEPYCHKE